MKSKPKTDQYGTFTDALKNVLQVSRAEMQERIAAQKKKRKSKTSASGHASRVKD